MGGSEELASGRVLIVHEAPGTRAQMAALLQQASIPSEAVESPYRCVGRFVDDPAPVVVLGLGGLAPSELELIRTLKREKSAPAIVVSFNAALRDMAIRALEAGADGYVPEPFYPQEFVSLVRAHFEPRRAEKAGVDWKQVASEVAHAVNNPLQVISLLLADANTTRKKLAEAVQEQLARIREAVTHLEAFGGEEALDSRLIDIRPIVEAAAAGPFRNVRFRLEGAALPMVRADERALGTALRTLFRAVDARAAPGTELAVLLRSDEAQLTLTIETDRALLREESPEKLLSSLFTVAPNRDLLPAFALPRALLDQMGGSFDIAIVGQAARSIARLSRKGVSDR
jgi:DNA-binding response OmpR family regulator